MADRDQDSTQLGLSAPGAAIATIEAIDAAVNGAQLDSVVEFALAVAAYDLDNAPLAPAVSAVGFGRPAGVAGEIRGHCAKDRPLVESCQ
jgi:hypothetical protein